MIAGLATQVLFTALFCLLLLIMYRRMRVEITADGRVWFMLGEWLSQVLYPTNHG